jgi:hypothetical protein
MIVVVKNRMEDVMKNSNFKICNIKFSAIFLLLILCSLFLGCRLRCGAIESILQLAPESRLPRWVNISGYQREDLTMEITCCVVPFGGRAEIDVYGPPPERKLLLEKAGKERWHPLSDRDRYNKYPNTKYPNYSIITIDGVDEVFEQREDIDILYITDDPNITAYNNK